MELVDTPVRVVVSESPSLRVSHVRVTHRQGSTVLGVNRRLVKLQHVAEVYLSRCADVQMGRAAFYVDTTSELCDFGFAGSSQLKTKLTSRT